MGNYWTCDETVLATLDVSGTMVVIGADGDFYNAGSGSGTAHVYEKVMGEWVL